MWFGYVEPSIVILVQLISGKLMSPVIHKLLFIIGTETWLNNSIHSSEVIPTDQYNIFRNDREGSKGGGVLIAVHNSIICSELFKSNNTELIAVKIHNQRSIILSAFYRPPFVSTSVRSSSIFVDFHKYILRFVCLVLLILMLVSTKTMS
jgi:hypothetical protein